MAVVRLYTANVVSLPLHTHSMDRPALSIDTFGELLPHLRGHVFHVSLASSLPAIKAADQLEVNDGRRESPFGNTSNGFFRLKGCVSFFDYRDCDSPAWDEHANKCFPTVPLRTESQIVIFFLADTEYGKLLSWENWKIEEAWSQRVVPHVECGYPSPVPLSVLSSRLHVRANSNTF